MTRERPPSSVRTLPDLVERKAGENSDRPFLKCHGQTLTYGELDTLSNRIAATFQQQGIEQGDQVCLFMYNSVPYVLTFFALTKLGAIVVPVDTRFSGETLSYVLSKTDAKTILLDENTHSAYEDVRPEVTDIGQEVLVGAGVSRPYREFGTLLDSDPSTVEPAAVDPADTVTITFVQQYTTEDPKGVMLPQHSYVTAGWEVSENLFGYTEDDRIFTTLPLYSIFAFNYGVMGAMVADAQLFLGDPFDPSTFWELVEKHRASIILYLGRMLSVLYNQRDAHAPADNPVELAIGHGFAFGADEVLIENFEQVFDITVLEGYGTTETGGFATYNTVSDHRAGSSGKPVSHVMVEVVDEDDFPIGPGELGEIVVRSSVPNAMLQEYFKEPEETIRHCRNQWVHTGDIGYFDEDGYLYFVANEENSIHRGQIVGRISSLEIESVIEAEPAVEQSAVVGIENEMGTEEIMAIVVPASDRTLDPVEICKHCERHLPRVKVPRFIDIRDELPRTSTGSVDNTQLAEVPTSTLWDRERGYELSR